MLMVDPLKEKIIARIKRDWPTSLKAWDERNSFYAIRNKDKPEDYRYPEPCSVIRLARSFDLDIPRHILFFDLSNRDPLINFGVPFEGLDYVYGLGARWDLISREYRKLAAVGNRKIVNWFENRENHMSRCLSATFLWPCYDFQTRMTHQIHVKFISGCDPLAALQDAVGQQGEFYGPEKEYRDADMCGGCAVQWDHGMRALRFEMFHDLPILFPHEG